MITGDPSSNYYVTKCNYVWFCEVALLGFITLGLAALVGSRRRIFSAALIIACLASSINVIAMKGIVTRLHHQRIVDLERWIEDYDKQYQEGRYADDPWFTQYLHRQKAEYSRLVEQWSEIQKDQYDPALVVVTEQCQLNQ